jgi:hypothetical protein
MIMMFVSCNLKLQVTSKILLKKSSQNNHQVSRKSLHNLETKLSKKNNTYLGQVDLKLYNEICANEPKKRF